MSIGATFSIALDDSGKIYGFGYNGNREIGKAGSTIFTLPTQISDLSNIIDISCGLLHTVVRDGNGKVYG